MSKWEHRRWRKLYTEEGPSFRSLPLLCRAVARELLALCDDSGRFHVGSSSGDELADKISRIGGADASDRRMMRKYIPMLLADGYLVRVGEYVCIQGFEHAQARRDRSKSSSDRTDTGVSGERTRNEPSMNRVSVANELATNSQRTANEPETKTETTARNHSESNVTVAETRAQNRSYEENRDPPSPPKSAQPEEPAAEFVEPSSIARARTAPRRVRDQGTRRVESEFLAAKYADAVSRATRTSYVFPKKQAAALDDIVDACAPSLDIVVTQSWVAETVSMFAREQIQDPSAMQYAGGLDPEGFRKWLARRSVADAAAAAERPARAKREVQKSGCTPEERMALADQLIDAIGRPPATPPRPHAAVPRVTPPKELKNAS